MTPSRTRISFKTKCSKDWSIHEMDRRRNWRRQKSERIESKHAISICILSYRCKHPTIDKRKLPKVEPAWRGSSVSCFSYVHYFIVAFISLFKWCLFHPEKEEYTPITSISSCHVKSDTCWHQEISYLFPLFPRKFLMTPSLHMNHNICSLSKETLGVLNYKEETNWFSHVLLILPRQRWRLERPLPFIYIIFSALYCYLLFSYYVPRLTCPC